MHVPSRLLVWPDAWHWITKPEDSRHFYEEVQRWLAALSQGCGPPPRISRMRRPPRPPAAVDF